MKTLRDEADLLTYSYDGALYRARPDAVVLAESAEDVRQTVLECIQKRVPYVARGAGTNLCGGCIPTRGGVVLSLAKLDQILEIDTARRVAVVEPGTVNLTLQQALEPLGFFYAPDPASYRVCTIGGNLAENAGGPRCLKYGVTTNHVLGLEAVMPDGSAARFMQTDAGPELMSLLVGAEGTLGIATKIWVKLTPLPEVVVTILVGFDDLQKAIDCVSAIVAAGALPRVLEAMDRTTVESIEAYVRAGYPSCDAVLLIELDGAEADIQAQAPLVEKLCRQFGCVEYRQTREPAEREKLWEGRRGAYAAVARIAPNVLVEDGVVPRGQLPAAYRRVREIAARHKLTVAMLFHAGDGNLHPNIAFDERNEEETKRVKQAGLEILQACVELGGSISGEHGIGLDKRAAMAWLFTRETLALFRRLKNLFDPLGLANPDKLLPLQDEETWAKVRPLTPTPSKAAQALIKAVAAAGEKGFRISASKLGGLDSIRELDAENLTVRVEAGMKLKELEKQLRAKGLFSPLPAWEGTIGGLIATKAWAGVRNQVLGMKVLLGNGDVVDLGGKVVKNVAGYDAARLLIGSWGALGAILEVTLKVHPKPIAFPDAPAPAPFVRSKWQELIKKAFDPDGVFRGEHG